MGRDATDLSSTSSPESGQWTFASRKRPFITECWRPIAAWWHLQALRQLTDPQAAARWTL